jgi:hypothetical protein
MRLAICLALLAPAAFAQVRVEPRELVKDGRLFLSGGGAWLERHDLYSSPGVALTAAWYLRESDGLEARTAFFISNLSDAAQEIQTSTHLAPDAQKPVALLLAGWVHSLTYGKLATSNSVIHFDVQSGLHLGMLITDRATNPAASASLRAVLRLGVHGFAQVDVSLLASTEDRTGGSVFALGILPVFAFGWAL